MTDIFQKRGFPYTRTFLVTALLVLLFAILVVQLPLVNYLGFEFSVAVALITPWIAGPLTIRRFRARAPHPSESMKSAMVPRIAGESLIQCLGILLIPFAVATLNAIVVRNCSYLDGVLFYLLIPGITTLWSVAFASFCAVVVRRAGLVYALCTLAILMYPLYTGYFSPQIYSFNILYGFFPGFSYDEALSFTPAFLLFRALTIVAALFFFLLSGVIVGGKDRDGREFAELVPRLVHPTGRGVALVACILLLFGSWLFRNQLGFEASADHIQKELGARYTTRHFQIYYSPTSFSGEEIVLVGLEHEFRYDQVRRALQVQPGGRIASYIYPDADTKQRLIGASETNIAKPWRGEIHLNKDSWLQTVKHELVHVMAGGFGMPIIRAHYNIGLVEGLATAIDGGFGNRTLHEYAAAMKAFGLVTQPERLIRPVGFALKASTVSYALMGSFCKYLIDRYGIMRFKEIYGGRNVEAVYGRSYDGLVAEWQDFLTTIPVPASWRSHVEFYFKRPSIFAKECARAVANLNEEAYRKLEVNNSVAAMNIFSKALNTSWNTDSYQGLVRAAYNAARYDTIVHLVDAQAQDSASRSGVLNLFLLYGDALWYRDDVLSARHAYRKILELNLSERTDESAALRLEALDDKGLRNALPDYFVGSYNDSTAELSLDGLMRRSGNPLLAYLKAKLYLRTRRYANAIRELDTLQPIFHFPILNAGREQSLGQAYFHIKQYQRARAHFWQSLNFISSKATIERAEDWIERCEWFEKRFTTD